MQVSNYIRKPFGVEAVQVTKENMSEVATWCHGEIHSEEGDTRGSFVHVRVHNPMNDRQTRAYVGDWVLYAGKGFKVYTNKAFNNSFDLNEEQPVEKIQNVFETAESVS